jgi:hypothetical protein
VRNQSDNLLPDDVADLAASLRLRIDRRNVTRALERTPVPGVVPPPRRGVPWTIPRTALVQVFAACLQRRALRELAPMGLRPRPLQHYEVEAARRMLKVPSLKRLVPRGLVTQVRRREAEEAAYRRREEERIEAMLRQVEANSPWARQQREAERRRRQEAELMARLERERTERALDRAYAICLHLAFRDFDPPLTGRHPNGRPCFRREDFPQYAADWPRERPPWWLPPPGMLEAVRAEPACKPYDYQEPDWRRWVPPYVPGRPWPWRDDAGEPPERPV